MKSTVKKLQKGGKVSASSPMMPATDGNNLDSKVIKKNKLSSTLAKLANSKMSNEAC